MQIISIIGQKGGTGKTTVAISLAVQCVKNNKSCVVIDLDPQASASNWGDRRGNLQGGLEPFVISTQASRLSNVLKTANDQGVDFVIIDTPGKSTDTSIAATKVADKVIIPIQPNIFDTETLGNVKDILMLSNNKANGIVVINKAQSNSKRHIQAIDISLSMGFEIAPTILFQRSDHIKASDTGLSAFEINQKGKASKEICALYDYVFNNSN